MSASEPVKEALDHLLDPLDLPAAGGEIVEGDPAADGVLPPDHVSAARGPRADVAVFFARARRSRRPQYKIPRLLIAWTALIFGVSALIWITFSAVGLR